MAKAKNTPVPPDRNERLLDVSERLRDYVTCLNFAQWLIENGVLQEDTSTDTTPDALAYSYAVRFSRHNEEIDQLLDTTVSKAQSGVRP